MSVAHEYLDYSYLVFQAMAAQKIEVQRGLFHATNFIAHDWFCQNKLGGLLQNFLRCWKPTVSASESPPAILTHTTGAARLNTRTADLDVRGCTKAPPVSLKRVGD